MSDGEEEVPKKGKGTKRKGKKGGPKRALSAYMFFCKEKRSEVRAANSSAGFSEIGKLLGEMWGKLPEEEKGPYNELNAQDKARYEKEKAEAPEAEDDDEEDGGGKKKKAKKEGKKKKDPAAPKSAPTAYMLFCNEERKRLKAAEPELAFAEVGKRMGENWKALSDEEKQPYQKEHAKLKKIQDAKKAEYNGKAEPKAKGKKKAAAAAAAEEEGGDDDADADAADEDE